MKTRKESINRFVYFLVSTLANLTAFEYANYNLCNPSYVGDWVLYARISFGISTLLAIVAGLYNIIFHALFGPGIFLICCLVIMKFNVVYSPINGEIGLVAALQFLFIAVTSLFCLVVYAYSL